MEQIVKIHPLLFSVAASLMLGVLAAHPAAAHPMGNFSINHYAHFTTQKDSLLLHYVLDMAEIPTVTERNTMHGSAVGKISDTERSAYLAAKIRELRAGLTLLVNHRSPEWAETEARLELRPGAAGLDTLRLMFTLTTPLLPASPNGWHIVYKDVNFADRTGWKEIVATAGEGTTLYHSTAAANDRSRELTVYPADPTLAPPQQTEAEFTVYPSGTTARASVGNTIQSNSSTTLSPAVLLGNGAARTPQDAFTQSISRTELTAGMIFVSLGLAFLFGAFHALSPGHGKAMVAAYLVGTRGTVRHAIFLGAVITLTHTIGVLALGLVTLAVTQYIVPERVYPILSVGSGLAIVFVGAGLLWQRLAALATERQERLHDAAGITSDASITWDEYGTIECPLPDNASVSLKSLILLGVTGGALPCPSALVVMLGAIALHRIVFGLALICAFSLGLAAVLTGIGVLVVRLRRVLDRLPLHESLTSRLPVLSAALITLVGLFLVIRGLKGQF